MKKLTVAGRQDVLGARHLQTANGGARPSGVATPQAPPVLLDPQPQPWAVVVLEPEPNPW
jgi:hypothetical protein